jgi:hypothetical protein
MLPMAVTVAIVIVGIVDLDQPARGLIRVLFNRSSTWRSTIK